MYGISPRTNLGRQTGWVTGKSDSTKVLGKIILESGISKHSYESHRSRILGAFQTAKQLSFWL